MSEPANLQAALSGRYEIVRELGRGGMATVYLARDLRHERQVAIKVLDPDLRALLGVERFLAEIRVTANLQHPNLLPLFDSGVADGLLFYVMPFVEGESLRAKLDREHQLRIDEAVHIATAVAGALEYAHARGVIHRDLKPENILLHAGEPVVADFGIALAVTAAAGERITQTGLSLGTPQYMSPEQATGDRAIDKRTDVYSLGAVTYEMLTGEPPHTGKTVQAIVARVLMETPPDVRSVRPSVPEPVAISVAVALEKVPADRWATAREYADALAGRVTRATTAFKGRPNAWAKRLRDPIVGGLAVSTLLLGGVLAASRRGQSVPRPIQFAALSLTPDEDRGLAMVLALSPDGSMLAYTYQRPGANESQLFVRDLSSTTPRAFPGTEGASGQFFSPNGEWIGYAASGKLWRVPAVGGTPSELMPMPRFWGASWLPDGSLVYSIGTALYRRAPGGATRELIRADTTAVWALGRPILLSDGRTLAYRIIPRSAEYSKTRLALTTIDGDKPVVLPFEVVMCLGAIDNWLIVVRRDRTLLAIPFDPQSRTATGQPVALSERANVVGWLAMAALSSSGTLAVGTGTDLTDLVWTDGHGAARPILSQLRGYDLPRLSPDGKRLAVMISPSVGSGLGGNYWVYDFTTSTLTQLTTDTASYYGEWLGDSRTFVYGQGRKGAWKLMRQPVDGSGPAVALLDDGAFHDFAVTPDGRQLIYATGSQPGQRGLRIRSVSGDTTSRPLVGFTGEEYAFRASPDGRWLAYAETRAGRTDVYARPIPGPGPRVQISTEESTEPVWARDGRRLFYRSEDGRVMYAASVTMTSSNLTVTGRTKLFEGQYDWEDDDADYDVAPNGKDFMMVRYPLKSREIMVTVNWADAVRQRLKGSSGR